jgi:hypothetical protein
MTKIRLATRVLIIPPVLAVLGCASMFQRPVIPPPNWQPLAPQSLGTARSATQRLRAAYGDQEMTLDCVVEVTAERITVVGLLPTGPRVFTVTYDGREVSAQFGALVPAALAAAVQAQRLLTDLQLALWPAPALERSLRGTAWSLILPDVHTRQLHYAGRLIAEVHYATEDAWNGRSWLVNLAQGYSLAVDSVSTDAGPLE